ncbi:MAG: hypothetical protein JWL83_2944 [Actinomycetia bacterium]|jgi:hypothetical protein|nr:hypothetical protein [Actinomycetes bacterium]
MMETVLRLIAAGCSCRHGVHHAISYAVMWGGGAVVVAGTVVAGLRERRIRHRRRDDAESPLG